MNIPLQQQQYNLIEEDTCDQLQRSQLYVGAVYKMSLEQERGGAPLFQDWARQQNQTQK